MFYVGTIGTWKTVAEHHDQVCLAGVFEIRLIMVTFVTSVIDLRVNDIICSKAIITLAAGIFIVV